MLKNFINVLSKLPKPIADAYVHSTATDPLQQFMFSVKFVPLDSNGVEQTSNAVKKIGFQRVSGLSWDLNVVEYHEGCNNYPIKLAGKASFDEVTMEKGVIPYTDTETINADTTNVLAFLQDVASDGTHRMNVYIQLLGRDGKIRAEYVLMNAFVSKWEGGEMDASSDDVVIETITVNYDYPRYTVNPTGEGTGSNWNPSSVTGFDTIGS